MHVHAIIILLRSIQVVVLLLCFAVQKKPNDDIIAGITSLDTKVQRDLKFFIESTIAQVTSHAIVAGTFQSGIGEPLPSLEVLEHPEPSLPSEFQPPDADDGVSRSSSLVSLPRKDSQESFCFPTPRRPSRQFNHGKFYNGLNSPAGVKWLQSPGITRGRSMGRTPLVSRVSSTSLQSQCVVRWFIVIAYGAQGFILEAFAPAHPHLLKSSLHVQCALYIGGVKPLKLYCPSILLPPRNQSVLVNVLACVDVRTSVLAGVQCIFDMVW